jgi:hypothetical protein
MKMALRVADMIVPLWHSDGDNPRTLLHDLIEGNFLSQMLGMSPYHRRSVVPPLHMSVSLIGLLQQVITISVDAN